MIAIEGIINSQFIDPINVHATGILRIKNTCIYEIEEKYNVEEKVYTGKKKYGLGISINNKEYILKYLPKKHIYDINKEEKKFKHVGDSFKYIFVKYIEYDLVKKERTYDELCSICREKYNEYIKNIKVGSNVVSNEKCEIKKTEDGIKYIVTYDLEEEAGIFQKTGE